MVPLKPSHESEPTLPPPITTLCPHTPTPMPTRQHKCISARLGRSLKPRRAWPNRPCRHSRWWCRQHGVFIHKLGPQPLPHGCLLHPVAAVECKAPPARVLVLVLNIMRDAHTVAIRNHLRASPNTQGTHGQTRRHADTRGRPQGRSRAHTTARCESHAASSCSCNGEASGAAGRARVLKTVWDITSAALRCSTDGKLCAQPMCARPACRDAAGNAPTAFPCPHVCQPPGDTPPQEHELARQEDACHQRRTCCPNTSARPSLKMHVE